VPYANNKNDGAFFIDAATMLTAFYYFQINHIHDDWAHSYYDRKNDNTGTDTYTFTLKASQELFITADFYDYRMYAPSCKTSYTSGTLALYSGSTLVKSTKVTDQLGYGFMQFSPLQAGKYSIKFTPSWGTKDVRDYTVGVYAKEKVSIYDDAGKTSENALDFS
jgi:hypothetical protein